ncbi:hypothetical protein [Bacterioplanoides sp.]|uniref:hypothetical protein n=1 Tax=Bacterioplanoides sp. TaxID=2066072 RepID=UPI003B591433
MDNLCSCGDKANIEATVKFHCKTCSSLIEKFTVKKPLKAAGLAAILAYGGSQFIDYAITDNRYPLAVEAEILNACTNSYQEPVSFRVHGKRRDVCLCALEETMNEISYVRYKLNEKAFLKAFDSRAKACN